MILILDLHKTMKINFTENLHKFFRQLYSRKTILKNKQIFMQEKKARFCANLPDILFFKKFSEIKSVNSNFVFANNIIILDNAGDK